MDSGGNTNFAGGRIDVLNGGAERSVGSEVEGDGDGGRGALMIHG